MENIYRIRLITLAQYLDEMEQTDLEPSAIVVGKKGKDGICYETIYPDFASAMPMNEIFPRDWIENEKHIIILKNKPNTPPFASFNYYFNIDIWEYMHCFVSYFQNREKYGGCIIFHEHVKPRDISCNIKELADGKLPF